MITTKVDSLYTNNFKIKVCGRSLTSSVDCLTSSQSFTVTVSEANPCTIDMRTSIPSASESTNYNDFSLNGTELLLSK